MRASAVMLSLAVLSLGCANNPVAAPYGATVEVIPEALVVGESPAFHSADNSGIAKFADVMVTYINEEGQQVPMENAAVEVMTPGYGVYVIPQAAVTTLDYPEAPDDWESQVATVCEDENGDFSPTEDWCGWYYDTVTGEYYEFGEDYLSGSSSYKPTYFRGATDGRGILRFFYFVDALPYDSDTGSQGDAQIWITIGVDDATLEIQSGET